MEIDIQFHPHQVGPSAPMSLKEYENLDLSKKSEAVKDLLERVPAESSQPTIVLTPVYGTDSAPPFLTQEMSAWFASFIQPYRYQGRFKKFMTNSNVEISNCLNRTLRISSKRN